MSSKFNIVVTRQLPQDHIQKLRDNFHIIYYHDTDEVIPRKKLLETIAEADGIFLTLEEKVDKEFFEHAKKMKVVSTMSVGFDHINVQLCKDHHCSAYNTPGVLTDTTAEFAITLMMAAARKIPQGITAVKSGEWSSWKPFWMCGKDIFRSTIGIFGLGEIGYHLVQKMKGFGCKFIYYNGDVESPFAKQAKEEDIKLVSFEELFSLSDIITVHCPLLPSTREVVNAKAFKLMKPDSILVNTSRGPVVHQDDLYDALSTGKIGAAALDVTVPEPLPTNHKLLTLPNCLIVPHIASASMGTRREMSMLAIDNLIGGLNNDPSRNKWKVA